MNDFLLAELTREHMARLNREAEAARLMRAADGGGARPQRRWRRQRPHPRHG